MWSNVEANVNSAAPTSRSKHAVCVSSTSDGFIYLLGGRSANLPLKDFWRFDPSKNVWEEIRTRGHCPPSLQEHTMLSWKNALYVFGGEIGFASTGETPLWILDLGTLVWRKMSGSSCQQPSGRRGHSAVVQLGSMYVYGGYQDLRGSSSELWSFDLNTEQWHLVMGSSCLEHPPPRHSHSCVVHDGAMWVYGGLTDLQPRGDFWKWDFEMQEWFRLKVQRGPGEVFGHAALQVMNYMVVFGGERLSASANELWRYSFATELWERISSEGAPPPAKCRQVAIVNPSLTDDVCNRTVQKTGPNESHGSHQRRSYHPPKSLSMCFSQQNSEGNRKRNFKFKVHPTVSRLCSKNTSSDEDDDDEYTVGYNHNVGQVNLRSLRDRISSSRLVRSISSGSYSILQNHSTVNGHYDEMERLMEAKANSTEQQRPRFTIQKSQSSDAVLETDNDVYVPKCRPKSETYMESSSGVPLWVENPNASLSPTSWSDGHQLYSHHALPRPSTSGGRMTNGDHSLAVRPSRLSYDGPLSTVKDVEEENSENADEANLVVVTPAKPEHINGSRISSTPATEILVDLDGPEQERVRYPSRFASSYTMSELVSQTNTPSLENHGLPHSASHSSGYHSFTDEEGDNHKEFAGCLNTGNARKKLQTCRDVELKTFALTRTTPTESEKTTPSNPFVTHPKERARSWDRSYQRKPSCLYPTCGSLSPTPCATTTDDTRERTFGQAFHNCTQTVGSEVETGYRLSRIDANQKREQFPLNFCIYLFGGSDQGAPGIYRQPISIWKLYV